MPGTSLAIEKARLVRPGTVAVLLFEVFPSPVTGTPASSVTLKSTTGGLLMVTRVMVTFIASAAHREAASSLAGVALSGMETTGAPLPGGPGCPGGPGGPAGPAEPASWLQPPASNARATSIPRCTNRKTFILGSRDRQTANS